MSEYLKGWTVGARLAQAYADEPKLCMRYALWAMKLRNDEQGRGFFDAVMAGMGS